MRDGQVQTELLQRYILGELAEVEQQQLEERYFAEPELVRELNAVRAELLDAWANGTLPPPQREQLERQLRQLPALRQHAEFALGLRDLFAAAPVSVSTAEADAKPVSTDSFFARCFSLLTFPPAWSRWATVGLLVVLGVWYVATQRRPAEALPELIAQTESSPAVILPTPQPAQTPVAPAASPAPHVTQGAKVIATFFLTPALTRGELKVPEILLPAATQIVRLQLETEEVTNKVFTAILQTAEGVKLWEKDGLHLQSVQGVYLVSLSLPSELLKPQTYRLLLLPDGNLQNATTYYFKVTA